MRALAEVPTAAKAPRGLGSWFTQATAGVVKTADIRDGVAMVDCEDPRQFIANASSSCGSVMLLAQLDRTARHFPSVTATRYSLDGSPE